MYTCTCMSVCVCCNIKFCCLDLCRSTSLSHDHWGPTGMCTTVCTTTTRITVATSTPGMLTSWEEGMLITLMHSASQYSRPLSLLMILTAVMKLVLFCRVDWLPTAGSMVCLFIYPEYGRPYMLVMCTFTVTSYENFKNLLLFVLKLDSGKVWEWS